MRRTAVASLSFAAHVFRGKVVAGEVIPYPRRPLGETESESLDDIKSSLEDLNGKGLLSFESTKDSGLAGVRMPEPFGAALPHTAFANLIENTIASLPGAISSSFLAAVTNHCGLGYFLVDTIGQEHQRKALLSGMSDGSIVVDVAAFEENCLRDVSKSETEAVFCSEQDTFTINGEKAFVNGSATHFLVFAKTETPVQIDGEAKMVRKLSCYLVPKTAEGVTVVDGHKLQLKDVVISASEVLGTAGDAYKDLMIAQHNFNYVFAATVLGLIRSIPTEFLSAHHLSAIYAAESALYAVTANLDKPVDDNLIESCLVAVGMCSTMDTILSDVLPSPNWTAAQSAEFARISTFYGDVKAQNETTNVLRLVAATCGVEEFGLYFKQASTMETIQLRTLRSIGIKDKLPQLGGSAQVNALESVIVKVAEATESCFVKHAQRALDQQLMLHRLAEASQHVYFAVASLSRAKIAAALKSSTAESEKLLSEAYATNAVSEATELCKEVVSSGSTPDETYSRMAASVCDTIVKSKMVKIE